MNVTTIDTKADASAESRPGQGSEPPRESERSRLWLWFIAAFAVQISVWTAWLLIASHHRVAEVPLATAPAHTR